MKLLTTEEQQVLHLIKTDKDQSNYFFVRVKSLRWFYILKNQNYFSPSNIQFDEDNNAQFWIVLYYLERVSEQVEQNPEYSKELLDIIESIVQFSKNEKKINNEWIWDSCIKIIANVPNSLIQEYLLINNTNDSKGNIRYGFKTWLDVFTDSEINGSLVEIDLGKKLLEKFLYDDSTIEYAELIIDILTKNRLIKRESSSVYEKAEVYLKNDPYWVLEAFKNNAEVIGQKYSESVIYNIADKLKTILNYEHKESYNNFKIGQDVYRITVYKKETGKLVNGVSIYEENKFVVTIKQFAPGQIKDVNLEADLFTLHDIIPEKLIVKDILILADSKEKFIAELKKKLPSNIDWLQAENFKIRFEDLYKALYQDFSQIWLQSLTKNPIGSTAREVLTVILRDILSSKYKNSPREACKILKDFLSDKYQFSIFRRLCLYCIYNYWNNSSSELFCNFLNMPLDVLEEYVDERDFYYILKEHYTDLPDSMKNKVLELINYVPEYYKEDEKQIVYRKYRILSALKNNSDFEGLYSETKQKAGITEDKPYDPKDRESGVFRVIDKSPISKDEILNKTIPELIKFLNGFQESGSFKERISNQGLGKELQAAVKDNPNHFTDYLKEFNNTSSLYIHYIFEGLIDAWNNNVDINWEKTLQFALEYISSSYLELISKEKQNTDPFSGRPSWILDNITRLIKIGCPDDNRTFQTSLFDITEEIFNTIIPYLKGEEEPKIQLNSITYAMNTTLGKTIESFIYYTLRKTRVTKQKPDNWGSKRYNLFIAKGIEAYIWLGYYLADIRYLDEEYTDNLLHNLLESADDNNWKMFMEGYLSNPKVYHKMYCLLHEHYKKVISRS